MSAELDVLKMRLATLQRRTVQNCEGLQSEMSDAQARADSAYRATGHADGAPGPLAGECLVDYRERLARGVQAKSKTWKAVNLPRRLDVLGVAEKQIFSEATASQTDPQNYQPGELRQVVSLDAAGRKITKFYGDPGVAWRPFQPGALKFVTGLRGGK